MTSSTGVQRSFILGQYVRIIGRPELLPVGAIRDDYLFVGDQWWPIWLVEAAFRKGLFDGTYKNGCAQTADGKRISSLEAAVAEIQDAIKKDMADAEQHHKDVCAIHAQDLRGRDARISQLCESERRLKVELRAINRALDDPRVDNTMTAAEVIKGLRSALKVIHTWASFPESFDCEQTKRLCMSALGRE